MNANDLLCGVVEGFYGRPWSAAQRRQLFSWMQSWGLNTYLYAPKDDLKHRTLWRQLYDESEAAQLQALIGKCQSEGVRFIYAIAPGLDQHYSTAHGVEALEQKVAQLLGLGCQHFALLFDDIAGLEPGGRVEPLAVDAAEQFRVANRLVSLLRAGVADPVLLFCPTPYCGRMAGSVKESAYLIELGRVLDPVVNVLWTGPEIISETITPESIRELAAVIGRKPILWDNLHANDYDLRRLYLGPYSGRPLELKVEIGGVLSNPNCEFEANFIPIRTLAMWANSAAKWEPREAYSNALSDWIEHWPSAVAPANTEPPEAALKENRRLAMAAGWEDVSARMTVVDLELLGDCFYLPFQDGTRATELVTDFQAFLRTPPTAWGERFERFCDEAEGIKRLLKKMTLLKNRDLLHAFHRQVWELTEELQLVVNYVKWLRSKPGLGEAFTSAEHRPKTYRGGLVAELQRLLPMNDHGEFNHRPSLIPKDDPNPYR